MEIPKDLPIPKHWESDTGEAVELQDIWQIVDSTKLQAFARCQRKYFYEYVLGWQRGKSNHLIFGQAWHEALEHLYLAEMSLDSLPEAWEKFITLYRRHYPETMDEAFGGKNPEAASQGLLEYFTLYKNDLDNFQVKATEIGGLVPIEEGRNLAFKIDLLIEKDGIVKAMEHKTGSAKGQTWSGQWALSIQIGTYLHALNCHFGGENTGEIIVNGAFFYKTKRDFVRVGCSRQDGGMVTWLNTVNYLYTMIEYEFAKLAESHPSFITMEAFPMNPVACTDFGQLCPYHDLCRCCHNPLRICEQPPSEFNYNWWNPLKEVKNEIKLSGEKNE